MSSTCYENSLVRDGTSQQMRLLKALLPKYVSVDERSIQELKEFVLRFSKQIRYFNTDGSHPIKGINDWFSFFDKTINEDQLTDPQYALFQAFLELFRVSQKDLNTLTKRHLDFYYQEVLNLRERDPVPDQVFMIFELARQVSASGHLVKKGTRLKAGKDGLGRNVFYTTSQDLVVNKARIKELKGLFRDIGFSEETDTGQLFSSPLAKSGDGQGGDFEGDIQSWMPFGNNERIPSQVGFAFSSPVLGLAEGTRKVKLKIMFSASAQQLFADVLPSNDNDLPEEEFDTLINNRIKGLVDDLNENVKDALDVFFSGEKEWITPMSLEEVQTSKEIRDKADGRALQFVNTCQNAKELAGSEPEVGPVYDSLTSGYGDQVKDYDIGETVAQKIVDCRRSLPNQKFDSLEELLEVRGFGNDKLNDLRFSFTDRQYYHTEFKEEGNTLVLEVIRTLGRDQDAVVGYNQEVLQDPFETVQPTVKVLVENPPPTFEGEGGTLQKRKYAYNLLSELKVENTEISVDVSEVKNLIVQNDQTVMDPAKTILPFGIIPVLGSNFYIGSQEVFQKKLDHLRLNIDWHGLPIAEEDVIDVTGLLMDEASQPLAEIAVTELLTGNKTDTDSEGAYSMNVPSNGTLSFEVDGSLIIVNVNGRNQIDVKKGQPNDSIGNFGFDFHYKDYNNPRTNTSFKSTLSILNKKDWVELQASNLVSDEDNTPLDDFRSIEITNNSNLLSVERDPNLGEIEKFDTDTKKGFIRLELSGEDFGHKDFQPSFTRKVLEGVATGETDLPLPREPYTPSITGISIDYQSKVDFSKKEETVEQFFHVTPFGASEKEITVGDSISDYLLSQHTNQGELYIGIEKLVPPQNLSILFQVSEGSENPLLSKPDLEWSYLSKNEWIPFEQFDILSDTTNGLVASGVINFSISKEATNENTILTKGLYWVRASVKENSGAIPRFTEVLAQAVVANFQDNNNDPDFLAEALPEASISKLEFSDSAISQVTQPFSSFGGKLKEQSLPFYRRVSERLRHKQRAITIWDYERLILQEFPSVYKVKCLNHTRFTGKSDVDGILEFSEVAPGNVSVIIVSNVRNRNGVDLIRPLTSINQRNEILTFIQKLNASPITLHVKNPIYEEIKVDFKVRFRPGFDLGFYKRQLEDEIKAFLSPWAYEDSPDIVFGGRLHQSRIIDFVDERPYVDYATCFEMIQYTPNDGAQIVEEAIATTSASILCSIGLINEYGNHNIQVLETEDNCNECDDNEIDPPPSILSPDLCEDSLEIEVEDELSSDVPYEFKRPNANLCPPADEVEECDETDSQPVAKPTEDYVLADPEDSIHFEKLKDGVIAKRVDVTYFVPIVLTKARYAIKVSEVAGKRVIKVEGDHTGQSFDLFESMSSVEANPKIYSLFGPGDKAPFFEEDKQSTVLEISNEDHSIQVGDYVNIYQRGANIFPGIFLPEVTEEMAKNEAKIRFQGIIGDGAVVQINRFENGHKDKLKELGKESLELANLPLSWGSGGEWYSMELMARKFSDSEPLFGWEQIQVNENYYPEAVSKRFFEGKETFPELRKSLQITKKKSKSGQTKKGKKKRND